MNIPVSVIDDIAAGPLLNCLLREFGEPIGEPGAGRRIHRLRGGGLLRVREGRRPTQPERRVGRAWQRLSHGGLVALVGEVLRENTGRANAGLLAEMVDSRDVLASILAARVRAEPPADRYLRSEQALLVGHPYHPAPKARGGGRSGTWLRYAPEAHARFPLTLLGVREDVLVGEGDTRRLDTLGVAPAGYRLLPAHPWQLELAARRPEVLRAFTDGRLVALGHTAVAARPTASVRTVHLPAGAGVDDVFLKFSLDVRITNDVRRLWRHDLVKVCRTNTAVAAAFDALPGPAAWLRESGYRTVGGLFETFAVLVREGLGRRVLPGSAALLAAALTEDFDGNPLDRVTDPCRWWAAYLRHVVPPVLEVFARHGLVLECHLQNTLIAVDGEGLPVQAIFRDAEGVKALRDVGRAVGWERLVYCLVVNHLTEIASTLAERFPHTADALWPAVRAEFERAADEYELPEAADLLTTPTLPAKANLSLRWGDADGAHSHFIPMPNPLRGQTAAHLPQRTPAPVGPLTDGDPTVLCEGAPAPTR
ncbi:IucA/IucC family protein [Embleya sp. NPDC020886]|uniref:IucA/IucC family protein n=1 Tax=Embleya sp. NPDC020886 TaxID=3363980 RepID=UPI0037B3311F